MADHAPLQARVDRLMFGVRSGGPWMAVLAAVFTTCTALGLTFVRPAIEDGGQGVADPVPGYDQREIDLRHSADPFPGNH